MQLPPHLELQYCTFPQHPLSTTPNSCLCNFQTLTGLSRFVGYLSHQLSKMSTDPKLTPLHRQLFEEGLKVRREVVGTEYVDNALANGSTEFSRPGQELVTEWCWGWAWTRDGLTRKQRSLLNIGMLMALNRAPELAVHIRGARNNGLTEVEIREAILHCTTYCGVPAGVDAMKVSEKVLNEMAEKGEKGRELGKSAM